MAIFIDEKKFSEKEFLREDEFERVVFDNYKSFFGRNTILINAKRKIDTKSLNATIPDGFLIDLNDIDNPEFYIIEAELASHDFFNHIFPQITKFFAFFRNNKSQSELVEKIYSFINTDDLLKKEFKKFLGEREIYKYLKDVIENSQNILLVIDEEKEELPEIIETYSDTWGKMVRTIIIKQFVNGNEKVYTLEPDFENIEFIQTEAIGKLEDAEESVVSEEYHLDGVSEDIRNLYFEIKSALLKLNSNLIFNPQKYYISIIHNRNIAFFKIRKKKIKLIVMIPEDKMRLSIKHYAIKSLTQSVQKFYNGPCAAIEVIDRNHLNEIYDIFTPMVSE